MSGANFQDPGFYEFFEKRLKNEKVESAIKGVSGMIHFARPDSPVLLESLGDLLAMPKGDFNHLEQDARQLAARAYIRASYSVSDETVKSAYRMKAREVLLVHLPPDRKKDRSMTVSEIETEFKSELAEGDPWFAKIEADEKRWIAEGKHPEKEFDRVYYQEPSGVRP